jgi:NAD(P)-dependent dehydrogenase (short-subunit alcohol dehydrogenase family)
MTTHGGALQGKVAVVTGSSKGIGKAMAAALAAEGASVMLTSRKLDALDAAADEIRAATPGARLATFAANAGEEDQAAACVAATLDQLGAVDVLINNAATNPYAGPVIDTELAAWDKTFRVNLRGFLVWTQQAWRAWQRDHGGTVINISSVGGIAGTGGLGTYNVTKAGVIHLTKILANELAPRVTVNCIAPGLVKTDFARVLWEPLGDAADDLVLPEDVASAAVFLAGPGAARITGHTLVVDGGSLIRQRSI